MLLELPSVKNLTTQDDLFWSFDSFGNSYTILIDTLEEECIDTYVRQLKMSINEIIKEEVEVLVKDKLDELQEKAYREELDTIDNIKKIVDYVFRKEIT